MRSGASLSLAVVGVAYPNADGSDRRFELLLCAPGEAVDLRLEPRNKRDERAVAVFSCREIQIGYLPAERCGYIGSVMSSGRSWKAVFQSRSDFGGWIRIAFDGAEPILPLQREPGIDENPAPGGFWPDEECSNHGIY